MDSDRSSASDQGGYFRTTIPSDLTKLGDVRSLLAKVGRAAGLSDDRVFDLQVVVSEASANAIEHAHSQVTVEAWVLYDRVVVEVSNDGVFQPGLYKDDPARRRGLGLPLMVSLADHVHIARLADETRVSLTFFREPVASALADALQSPRSPDAAILELETEAMKLRQMTARAEELAQVQSGIYEEGRRRAEELQTLMDVVPVAIWVARDPECRTIIGNRTADEFYEAEPGENVSAGPAASAQEHYHDTTRRFFRDGRELEPHELPMQRAAAEGIDIRGEELQVLRPSGRWLTIVGNASPLFDAEGRVRGSVGAFLNVTRLRQAEQEAGEHAVNLQFLSAAASGLLGRASLGEVLTYAAEQISHLAGRALVAVNEYQPETREVVVRAFLGPASKLRTAAQLAGREPKGLQVHMVEEPADRLRRRGLEPVEGGCFALLSSDFGKETCEAFEREAELGEVFLMPLSSEEEILGSVVIFADRTEGLRNRATIEAFAGQVALAIKRARAEGSLVESEQQYRSFFEQNSVGIAQISLGRRYLRANRRFSEVLGYEPGEIVGRTVDEITHPDDMAPNLEVIRRLASGESTAEVLEKRFRRKDGSYVWTRLTASVMLDAAGEVAYFTSVVIDITEERQAQQRVERDRTLLEGIARILAEALSDRSEEELGDTCLEVARQVTGSRLSFLAEFDGERLRTLAAGPPTEMQAALLGEEAAMGDGSQSEGMPLEGLFGRVIREMRSLISTDPGGELGGVGAPVDHPPLETFLGVPLLRDERPWGIVAVADGEQGYGDEQQEMLEALAPVIVEAYGRKRAEEGLKASARHHRQLAKENERLYREQLRIAQNLQAALTHLPEQLGPLRISHLYRSATRTAFVGGDFYDVFPVGEDETAVLIGDVSGHGVEAARMALLVKDAVHAFLHQSSDPADVLAEANALLLEKAFPGFVSVFLGVIHLPSGTLRYAMAAHPYLILKRKSGEVERLVNGSVPLAVLPDASWETAQLTLTPDDLLFLYTDGLVEIRRDGQFLGEEGLLELVRSAEVSLSQLPNAVMEAALEFSGGELHDDVAILAVSMRGKQREGRGDRAPEGRLLLRRFPPTWRKPR